LALTSGSVFAIDEHASAAAACKSTRAAGETRRQRPPWFEDHPMTRIQDPRVATKDSAAILLADGTILDSDW
jgi:hypothetical protein